MATKKKTNYIVYELEKLQKFYKQLENYLDNNPPNKAEDRLDVRYSQNGNPIVKVIASKESQVTLFSTQLQKLPALLESINNLRKLADADGKEVIDEARGGRALPGLFRHKMLTEKVEAEEIEVDNTEEKIEEIIEEPIQEDDDIWEDED